MSNIRDDSPVWIGPTGMAYEVISEEEMDMLWGESAMWSKIIQAPRECDGQLELELE